jgi:hypothetical protein
MPMTTGMLGDEAGAVSGRSASFERFAGVCAALAGVSGFLYAVAFVVLQHALLGGLFLTTTGLLTSVALLASYERLRATEASFALLALVPGLASALGSAVHGGYDLANAINPPPTLPDLANLVDPRGLLTFGLAGAALLVVSWLVGHGGSLPRGLSYLGYASAVLLLARLPGRLIVLDPTSPVIVAPALLRERDREVTP